MRFFFRFEYDLEIAEMEGFGITYLYTFSKFSFGDRKSNGYESGNSCVHPNRVWVQPVNSPALLGVHNRFASGQFAAIDFGRA